MEAKAEEEISTKIDAWLEPFHLYEPELCHAINYVWMGELEEFSDYFRPHHSALELPRLPALADAASDLDLLTSVFA